MGDIYITSDTHFCHDKEFLYRPRGFDNIKDMNELIIHCWNNTVKPDDIVYHLGDVMLNDDDEGLKCIKKLNGHIYLAYGNHDTDTRLNKLALLPNIEDIQQGYRFRYGKRSFILTHYPTMVGNYDEDQFRTINLCGHTHTKDQYLHMNYGCYHVEYDAHLCIPSLDEILEDVLKYKETRLNEKKEKV